MLRIDLGELGRELFSAILDQVDGLVLIVDRFELEGDSDSPRARAAEVVVQDRLKKEPEQLGVEGLKVSLFEEIFYFIIGHLGKKRFKDI